MSSRPLSRWETVRIEPVSSVDPVDRMLTRRGGRARIQSITLRQAPVDDTLQMFASLGRFNVVVPEQVHGRKVTLQLRNVSVAGAFRAVLRAAGLEAHVVAEDIVEVRTRQ